MNKEFVWSDDLVKEYLRLITSVEGNDYWQQEINKFKESKEVKRDWEVYEFQHGVNHFFHIGKDTYACREKSTASTGNYLLSHNATIISVKRLSDNVVFSVGDELSGYSDAIKSFEVVGNDIKVYAASWGYYFLGQIYKPLQRTPLPILKTEDGVNIFDDHDDELWRIFVSPSSYEMWKPYELGLPQYPVSGELYFSTKKAADEYVILNKPFLSVKEVLEWMVVYIQYHMREQVSNGFKEYAKQKLENNKYCN